MPDRIEASEQTPLLHEEAEGRPPRDRLRRVYREFNEALLEEDPELTMFDLLARRPFTLILGLLFMAMLVVAMSSFQALKSPEFLDKAICVPKVDVVNTELVAIRNREIEVKCEAVWELDYQRLGPDSVLASVAETMGRKLGSVNVAIEGPINIFTKTSDSVSESGVVVEDWDYLISVYVPEWVNITTKPMTPQHISATAFLAGAGRTEIVRRVVLDGLNNKPISIKAQGVSLIKKYGISFRVPFTVIKEVSMPDQISDELAELSEVTVGIDQSKSLNVTALVNATLGSSGHLTGMPPFSAVLPSYKWKIKIPGCSPLHLLPPEFPLEEACKGETLPFTLNTENGDLNIYFHTLIDTIPDSLTAPCMWNPMSKSPLDVFISKYLAGEKNMLFVEGIASHDQPRILNDLLSGYDVPYSITGKAASEKLIQSVALEEVRFGNQISPPPPSLPHRRGPGHKDENRIGFSGRAQAVVIVPHFLNMQAKSAILVTGARGVIQLFDNQHKHFAQILANKLDKDGDPEWLPTVSLAGDEAYKITCFFDNVPTEITDNEVLAAVSREIVIRGHSLIYYDAVVDIQFATSIGEFVAREVRIRGETEMYA